MMKFAELIDENAEELAILDCIDAEKLFDWGQRVDIPSAAETLRYYAGAAGKIHGETLKMSSEHQGVHVALAHWRGGPHHPLELSQHHVLDEG